MSKYKINRTGEVDDSLWNNGYRVRLLLKFLGFYILEYTNE